ncbi:hypothetical protein MYO4S_00152 [Serratia phage 4S]|nr:hypothetical protein MYO4S_00152 [Serratia phage 4S]
MEIQAVVPKSRANEFSSSIADNPMVEIIGTKVSDLHVKFDLDVIDSMIMDFPMWVTVL